MPSVLLVGQTPPPLGGIAIFINRLVTGPVRCGWTLAVFSTSKPRMQLAEFSGVWKGGIPATLRNLWQSLVLIAKFVRRVWRERPDVIHIHTSHSMGFWWNGCFVLAARPLVPAIVLHIHGSKFQAFYENTPRPLRWVARWVLNRSNVVVALSRSLEHFLQVHAGVKQVRVIPNGVPDLFFRSGSQYVNPDQAEPLRLVFVGALVERKGIFDLLHALTAAEDRSILLNVVGEGQRSEVEALARHLGLADRVSFAGSLQGEALRDAYHAAHVFVLPSYAEGVPLVILEAMAAGLAVVTTAVGGIPDLLTDGVEGVLLEPGKPADLAVALTRLARDRDLVRTLAQASRKLAEGYRFDRTIREVWQVYEHALSER